MITAEDYKTELEALHKTVDAFAYEMKKKLGKKARDGWSGWDDKMKEEGIDHSLYLHVRRSKGEEVDIANLAMMLWNMRRKEKK